MTRSSIALAVVTLIVGSAVGYLAGVNTADADATARPLETTSTSPAAAPVSSDATTSIPRRERTSGGERATAPRARAASVADVERGHATVTGTVVGPGGAPLPGVLVRVETGGWWDDNDDDTVERLPPGSPPPRADVERRVRAFEERLRREEAGVRETTTDALGNYVLSDLDGESFEPNAWLVGYRIVRADGKEAGRVKDGDRCDFKATLLRSVTVAVLLPDGTPAKSARISWTPAAGGDAESSEWSTERPEIAVEPGTYSFAATAGVQDHRSRESGRRSLDQVLSDEEDERSGKESPLYRGEPQSLTVGADGQGTLTIRLAGQPALRVKLVFASADHPSAVRVAALRSDASAPATAAMLASDSARVKARWTDGPRDVFLTGLEPGTYVVGVTFRGGLVGASTTVVVGSDIAEATLQVDSGIQDWVKVWVRAPDGSLLRDAKIDCGCKGSEGGGETHLDVAPEADGSYRVTHFEHDAPFSGTGGVFGGSHLGDGKRTYFVRATSKTFGDAHAIYDPATDREVSVQFVEPARLRVVIGGYAESPNRSRILLTLEATEEDVSGDNASEDGKIDAQGEAAFPPVRPGAYELVLALADEANDGARRRWSRWNSKEVARIPAALAPGDTSMTIGVPAVIDLVVSFDAALDPKQIQLQRVAADGTISRVSDEEAGDGVHEVAFRDLVVMPGRYRLVSRVVGDMWIDLPGPSRVVFRPRPFNSLQVRTRDAHKGYLSEAGLQEGDVVVAIDGTECQSTTQIDKLLAAAREHEHATLTIVRGGRRIDVVVDAKRLDDGGRLAPWVR